MTSCTPVERGGLLLHVGPHKTGTTSVQRAFASRRDLLAAHGVAYPGKSSAPHGAVIARLGTHHGWYDELEPTSVRRWERFCETTRSLDATVVVSSEALCHADDVQATELCGELRPGPVRVVITLRPLAQLLPSSWQEYLKAGWGETYDEFLDEVLRRPSVTTGVFWSFWIRQDHGRLVERWSAAVGPDRVTVVVADPGRPALLLKTFEDLVGVPRNTLLDGRADTGANRSLTVAECELLRRLNVDARGLLDWDTYNTVLRAGAFTALADRPVDVGAERLGLPLWARDEAHIRGRDAADRIRRTGVEVVGDLDTLGGTGLGVRSDNSNDDWTMPQVDSLPADAFVAAATAAVRSAEERRRSTR
jgi:hypothetical protein